MNKFSNAFSLITAGRLLLLGLGTLLAMNPLSAAAVTTAKATPVTLSADQIRAKAAKFKELRDLLNDREQSIRLTAFNELVNSPDPAAQELAFEVGFSSADVGMRALAMRKRLMRMANFSIEITEVSGNYISKAIKNGEVNPAPSVISWFVIATDEREGVLKLHDTRRNFSPDELLKHAPSATISGLNVTVNTAGLDPGCAGSMTLAETNILIGQMVCKGWKIGSGSESAFLKIRMRVQ